MWTSENKKLNWFEIFRFFLITIALTFLYIDRYGFGGIFAYISLIVLIILWTIVFSYVGFHLTNYYPKTTLAHYGTPKTYPKKTISLILTKKLDIDKILLTIMGLIFCVMVALASKMLFGDNWAIASFLFVGTVYGYWFFDNWLKK